MWGWRGITCRRDKCQPLSYDMQSTTCTLTACTLQAIHPSGSQTPATCCHYVVPSIRNAAQNPPRTCSTAWRLSGSHTSSLSSINTHSGTGPPKGGREARAAAAVQSTQCWFSLQACIGDRIRHSPVTRPQGTIKQPGCSFPYVKALMLIGC